MKCSCEIELKALYIQKNKYTLCPKCGLLSKISSLSMEEERKRYDLHQWDGNYVKYMQKVYSEIKPWIQGYCLDFGCGKYHTLANLLNEDGIPCAYYDLHYYPNQEVEIYDTILLIEVFEHLKEPYDVLKSLISKLTASGRIIIKTKPYDGQNLDHWWYLRDETHMNFILKQTFSHWELNLKMIYQKGDIFVLKRI